jgi:anti-sigma regulatory factor (Ser/Thr protein kinase)
MAIAAMVIDSNPSLPYLGACMTPSIELSPEPRSVRVAREFVAGTLREAGLEAWTAALLVTELATNAVEHVGAGYLVDIEVAEVVRVEVSDGSPHEPVVGELGSFAERGRGLALVEKLALRWGSEGCGRGKRVWFEVEKQPAS